MNQTLKYSLTQEGISFILLFYPDLALRRQILSRQTKKKCIFVLTTKKLNVNDKGLAVGLGVRL